MLINDKKIAIVGGGPGGLSLANLLKKKGADVKVYERDTDRYARIQGAPLDLHDESGLAALREAGLLEKFKQHYLRGADRKVLVDEKATVFYSDHNGKQEENFGAEQFRPEIDRGDLRDILLDSLEEGTIIWNRQFLSMEPKNEGWILHFKETDPVYADIVIAADGANSRIRPYITDLRPLYTGFLMLEGHIADVAKDTPRLNSLLNGGKIMAFGKKNTILVMQKAGTEAVFYLSFEASEKWTEETEIDLNNRESIIKWFKNHFSGWNESWIEMLENVQLPLIPRVINCMPTDKSWQPKSNITMLGDAAHQMPPYAGEGVNMAMQDALELCHALTGDTFPTVGEAIAHYEASMRARASEMAEESLANGKMMHSDTALEQMVGFFKMME